MKPSHSSHRKTRRQVPHFAYKILHNFLWLMVYALPAVLFFSYHPVIGLGTNDSMNFELSLPLIWLVLFDIFSFIAMIALFIKKRQISLPGLTDRRFFLLSIFPLYLTISVFWSANPLRGLLTAGVMWAVFFAVFALLFVLPQTGPPRRLRTHTLLVMFVSAVLICKFCYAQSIMDTLGLSRDATLLCTGCTYRAFGFPHPSGFAIEPQFMGNLLLAPTLTALYLVVFRSRKFAKNIINEATYLENTAEHQVLHDKIRLPEVNWKLWQRIGMIILAGFLSMTLFFTFSRGAIYAYAVAIFVMLIFALKRHQFRWSLITIPIVSFLLSLTLQGTFAAVGPTAETFVSGVTKSIHQLSLGLIDLRPASTACGKPVENSSENCAKPVDKTEQDVDKLAGDLVDEIAKEEDKIQNAAETTLEDAIFEGYVPESTNTRLKLNQVAVWTWLSAPGRQGTFWIGLNCHHFLSGTGPACTIAAKATPTSILFGVGLGGAGTAMHAAYPDQVTSAKEIVQHQGFSLLLETGLIGIALAIFGILVVFVPQLFTRKFLDGKFAARSSKFAQEGSSGSKPSSYTANGIKASRIAQNKPLKASPSPFWHHPALPLLLALIIAYLVTLNFFSGLPNALQIYLMPPLLYLIFFDHYPITVESAQNHDK